MSEHWQDPPLAVVSSLLRAMLIASEGHRLIAGDFSQIEARVLGWLAGSPSGTWNTSGWPRRFTACLWTK